MSPDDVHFDGLVRSSLFGFMFTLIPWIDVHIDPKVSTYNHIQGQDGSKVITEECEGEDDG